MRHATRHDVSETTTQRPLTGTQRVTHPVWTQPYPAQRPLTGTQRTTRRTSNGLGDNTIGPPRPSTRTCCRNHCARATSAHFRYHSSCSDWRRTSWARDYFSGCLWACCASGSTRRNLCGDAPRAPARWARPHHCCSLRNYFLGPGIPTPWWFCTGPGFPSELPTRSSCPDSSIWTSCCGNRRIGSCRRLALVIDDRIPPLPPTAHPLLRPGKREKFWDSVHSRKKIPLCWCPTRRGSKFCSLFSFSGSCPPAIAGSTGAEGDFRLGRSCARCHDDTAPPGAHRRSRTQRARAWLNGSVEIAWGVTCRALSPLATTPAQLTAQRRRFVGRHHAWHLRSDDVRDAIYELPPDQQDKKKSTSCRWIAFARARAHTHTHTHVPHVVHDCALHARTHTRTDTRTHTPLTSFTISHTHMPHTHARTKDLPLLTTITIEMGRLLTSLLSLCPRPALCSPSSPPPPFPSLPLTTRRVTTMIEMGSPSLPLSLSLPPPHPYDRDGQPLPPSLPPPSLPPFHPYHYDGDGQPGHLSPSLPPSLPARLPPSLPPSLSLPLPPSLSLPPSPLW